MTELLLATRNRGKLREVRQILAPTGVSVTSLAQRPVFAGQDVVEDGATFVANALIKARWAAKLAGEVAVADDSGLEVDALNGEPGVYSARYAGDGASDEDNNRKLVEALCGVPPERRGARFRCAAVLFVPDGVAAGPFESWRRAATRAQLEAAAEGLPVRLSDGVAVAFTGVLEGRLIDEPRGQGGFGYDPLFLLPDAGVTTAQLQAAEKNARSHRGRAFRKLAEAIVSLTENGASW